MATSDVGESSQDAILVAVMGQTGTGKSNFINKATGGSLGVGHSLESCTQDIQQVAFSLDGRRMVLIDSPGFDDTTRTDIEILKIIGLHLQKGAEKKKFLTGVIYMRRITDNKMPGSALNNLRVLRKLCGAEHYAHIALVTSQWDVVVPDVGAYHEHQLRMKDEYWGEMIRNGATVNRHSNSTESAIEILRQFLPKSPFESDFQKQFIAADGNVGDTAAGKEIIQILLGKLGEYEKRLSILTEDNKRAKIEKARMDTEMQTLMAEMKRLKQEREEEKKEEREKEKKITENLREKEKLIDEANAARENVESDIRQLKAAIDMLRQEKEKENSLNEDLTSKQKLIDEARIAKEKAESDVQDFEKEMEGVQQGKETKNEIKKDLKSKEELVAEAKAAKDKAESEKDKANGEMQGLMAEIEKLKLEMEKQKAINENLKSKKQLLEAAEASKKQAEKEREEAEGEVRRLQEDMEKLQLRKEKEKAVNADLEAKNQRIREIEKEKEEQDNEMDIIKADVDEIKTHQELATEAIEEIYDPQPANSKRWSRFSHCGVQ